MNHDANGKMTPEEHGRQFVYDAQGNLVEVRDARGRTILSHTYEKRKRKIQKGRESLIRRRDGKAKRHRCDCCVALRFGCLPGQTRFLEGPVAGPEGCRWDQPPCEW